ncbi:MAG: diaminopropionate ammonia-lyase [Sandaracinaceae bacterium]
MTKIAGAAVKYANNARPASDGGSPILFQRDDVATSVATITQWPGYQPTPLVDLSGLADEVGVARIYYKDEGGRFGLGSFKALGGAYAVERLLSDRPEPNSEITVACATDGNHGLSVAWGAKRLGCRCVIYIHADVSAGRERALRAQGADVIRIDGNYDASVRHCAASAKQHGWFVVSDTTVDDRDREVPTTVMAGYAVMVSEIIERVAPDVPTHVFVQGGVGGLAATICEVFRLTWGDRAPSLVVVEPERAACLYESALANTRTAVEVREETVMAGLSCGEVSIVAWDVLGTHADAFLTLPDAVVPPAMRLLASAPYGDPPLVAGESAVAGLAALIACCAQPQLAEPLGLSETSRVLVIGTEGATDPDLYHSLTGHTPS